MQINVLVADAGHVKYADEICEEILISARERGTGIARRTPEYVSEKMLAGKAVIAIAEDGRFAGFSYIETWGGKEYVANSGLIVAHAFRGLGLAMRIKTRIFQLSREKFPNAKIFSITTGAAVMKMNYELGFRPVQRGDYSTIINFLLKEQYMGYGNLPKGLLKFHRYGHTQRTPLEEHIVEGAEYARQSDDSVNIHFTVSPEHRALFRKKVAEVKLFYEKCFGVKLNITFSEQKHYTDIIAVNEQNEPIRDDSGHLVFRPGGNGALIENLNEQRADIIFIKNIDNVVPDWMKHTTIIYKKVLAGLLLSLQQQAFKYLRMIDEGVSPAQLRAIEKFAKDSLHIVLPDDYSKAEPKQKAKILHDLLNRPMRICGMVKNQGEPGGGPFITLNTHGIKSLQIVETAQINRKDEKQEAILNNATHFNPVDLVCATKNYHGRYFDLRKYVDPDTGFISKKTKGAVTLKSQELPGLWNGAMAYWNTIFVEVPLATFNPVKTVNDLLRKEHREG